MDIVWIMNILFHLESEQNSISSFFFL